MTIEIDYQRKECALPFKIYKTDGCLGLEFLCWYMNIFTKK